MTVIAWKSCYEIGVGTFDDEHHTLVQVINDLHEALRQKRADEVLHDLLDILVEYTVKHFDHEEVFMKKHQYPQMAEHKEEHIVLKNKIGEYRDKIQSGETGLSPEIMGFLRKWLLDHIVETDKQFGAFLREHSIYDCGPAAI